MRIRALWPCCVVPGLGDRLSPSLTGTQDGQAVGLPYIQMTLKPLEGSIHPAKPQSS